MGVRHVDGAGAELDLLGGGGDPGQEGDAGGDVLGPVGDMLADIGLGKPEFIGQQEGFTILPERLTPILVERMDWHGKETEIHGCSSLERILMGTDGALLW